ncbi:glycosyltransferase [Longilinea arvoryzae]|uniref:Glycosyltransferase n=1 Tax=Longilinea arvoryzae TaxID=360412 RepID=A0A0S7BID8_9CHLR|nr:glycosyltransferase family 2 protein [Longilinea arvoryzae]GAP13938.1 glycosyltransferase [Longilinea arvoryzae]
MDLSVISPVYNEEESVVLLHQAVTDALSPLDLEWELVLVNDGSTDGSQKQLDLLAEKDPTHVRVVEFRRNFGQTTAISAGIDYSQGKIIVLIDADLQNDPADIPMMLAKLDEGYDVVSGWRVNRQDTFITRTLPSHIANGLISRVTGVHLHDYGCTLKAYRREVITGFRLYGEMHRFIPVYAKEVGADIVEVPVHHHPRRFGKAKYGLERTLKVVLDLFTVKFFNSFSSKPIYLFGGLGLALILAAFIVLLFLIGLRIFAGEHMIRSPLLILCVMLVIMGFQSILQGLIAELLMRTYHESQHKLTYTVRKTINIEEKEKAD